MFYRRKGGGIIERILSPIVMKMMYKVALKSREIGSMLKNDKEVSAKIQDDCDVVVRGSGKIGFVAALEAAKNGDRVLYLEENLNDSKVNAFKIEMLQ